MFTFHAFSADSTKKFWRCVIRSCGCRLHADVNDVIVNRLGHHAHGSDAAGVEVAKIKASMKRRALDTMELPSQIHNQAIRFAGQSVQGQMPSISATKKLIQRALAQNEAPCQHLQISHLSSYQTSSGGSWWNWPGGLRNFISGWTYGNVALTVFIISGVSSNSSSPNLIKLVIFSCPYSYIENIHFSLMKPNPKA